MVVIRGLHSRASVPALALGMAVALAGPALAQQAPASPAAANQAAAGAQLAPPAQAQPTVTGRELMTPQERASFRREMRQATPEQRDQLWRQKRGDLAQRASQRGMVLAESGSGPGAGEARWRGRDGGNEGSWMSRMLRRGPRAP